MSFRTVILLLLGVALWIVGGTASGQDSQRLKVRKVEIDGNQAFDDRRLYGLMLTVPSKFLTSSYYFPEVLADDLDNLIAFYRQNGFLDARLTDTLVIIDSAAAMVDVMIGLEEGEVTRLEGITIFGNSLFPDYVLRPLIDLQPGDPLKRGVIQDGIMTMLSFYADDGYLDASITPDIRINDSANLAVADLTVKEGAQASINDITIEGLKRTHPPVVQREFLFRKGEVVKYSRLLESQRRLYLTGLFESVFIRPTAVSEQRPGLKDILVEIKERPSSEFSFMIGFGSIEKIRGRTELTTNNLSGTGRQLGGALEANFIKQGLTASFTEPWTLGTRWRTDANIFFEFREEPGYHTRGFGARLTVGRQVRQRTDISLTYRFENVTLTDVEVQTLVTELDPRVRSLTLSIIHDTRNNLFDTHNGWFIGWNNEIAGSFLHGSNTFARSVVKAKYFTTAGAQRVLGSSLEVGWMDYFGSSREIPLQERFYTGGPVSLRGFGYQMVGPLDDTGEPVGGNFKIVWHLLEIRQGVYRMFGTAAFVDIGNVWPEIHSFRMNEMRSAAGIGLRIFSPLGIVRLDYSANLDRRPHESGAKLYLAMGQAF